LDELRKDPWGHDYDYRLAPAPGVPFEVRSAGPDGRFGTADDVVRSEVVVRSITCQFETERPLERVNRSNTERPI
jgi:hypothetical protein